MKQVWIYDIKFDTKCRHKISIIYYKVLAKALKEANLSFSNRFNDSI